MAVILGSMTSVTVDGNSDGYQSANWNRQVQNNRLWQIGQWVPYTTQVTITETVSLTTYAGALDQLVLDVTTSCSDSTAEKIVIIDPQSCSALTGLGISGNFFVTSYSYSKGDPQGFGTETWSLQRWVDATGETVGIPGSPQGDSLIGTAAPDYVLQGISEGTYSNEGMSVADVGITAGVMGAPSTQGSVSAGFPGQGSATVVETTIPTAVGAGAINAPGGLGQSSVTIPHQPLYV